MKFDEEIISNAISAEDKKKAMLERELNMLKSFYERKAITKENYEKGIAALEGELEALRGE